MNKKLLSVALLCISFSGISQVQQIGTPLSWKDKVGMPKEGIQMVSVDNEIEATNEMIRRGSTLEKEMRFGKELPVNIDFMSTAEIKVLPNGTVVRQLKINSAGALSINLIFDQFQLSKNARLYLSDGEKKEFIGAHTSLNNNENHMLGTELIHDDVVIIELQEPAEEAGTSQLHLGTVVHGYFDLESEVKALGSSGNCEYDVNCPIGAGWENQRNSVAMMVNGGGFCTGSLINNTSGTIIPYFLSANHCGTSPGSWVFRFKWERTPATAICATANNTSNNGPTTMNINGGVLKANYSPSDFTLTELNSAPDPAWGVYYNGFNATDIPATSAVGIHHPAGDIKKISFENTPLISTTFNGGLPDSHWGVTSWDNGVTEGGSSGSPLFDQNHRTVGQLHGGASVCGGSNLSDEYGKLYTSWLGGGTNASQLKFWLDPSNTGSLTIDGVDPAGPGVALDAALSTISGASGTICSASVSPSFTLINNGSTALTSATVHYGYDGDFSQTYAWTGSLNQYQSQVIALPSATLAGGAHVFNTYVSGPNTGTDENNNNDTIESNFTIIVNPTIVDLSLTTDRWGSEITWALTNTAENVTFYTGGPYADLASGTGATYNASFCLADGCYHFIITDDFGDGMSGNPAGHYELISGSDTLAELTTADAGFGNSHTSIICVGTSGLKEVHDLQESWSLYPNPATDLVEFGLSNDNSLKEITLITAQGAIVKQMSTYGTSSNMSISDLSSGVYFVQMKNALGTSTKQLIIK
ncbi:T9SS type A sorting domain-containing protein [Fluviicola chungangensis]|uniref:T9SS type A sorting domain-containing protein n=1 Tax=Fluviicola chungangensis TaxID=2597671 RepID=A0A556N2U5_9FLAO|nr:T9SS type A sorting domain-containing protein [Fluviicola chungangensis]TSJ46395.1 T9SS type A sorting domain-containing protein [Fluviicola chungangensis]